MRSSTHGCQITREPSGGELREGDFPRNTQIDVSLLDPTYTGSEALWLDGAGRWLVYASHESSVAITGQTLLAALKDAWPAWREHPYLVSGP